MHRLSKEHVGLSVRELAVALAVARARGQGASHCLILVRQAGKGDAGAKEKIYKFYLAHTRYINNWDLVDASAREIVGGHLADKSREPLVQLARSTNMWERRISIVATHYFIRQGEFADTLRIARLLLGDKEDLIHKAVGWMLREVGKQDQPTLERFLRRHGKVMPRTALRYSIERFPKELRLAYLTGKACD